MSSLLRLSNDLWSWPGLSRPSTILFSGPETWMPGTRPGMTRVWFKDKKMLERFGDNLPAREVKFAPCDLNGSRPTAPSQATRACSARSISARTW
jgi:hypothetical protein